MANDRRRRASTNTARSLRANATPAEALLWKFLRRRHTRAYKFRRQHEEMGPYVLDFYCAKAKLAIEVDGGIHNERKPFDAVRTQWLETQGLIVLRFTNEEVMTDPEAVTKQIGAACGQRIPAKE